MKIFELKENWKFKEASAAEMGESHKAELENPPDAGEWLPATVPGFVHLDLLSLGKIEDPFMEDFEHKVRWVEERDWIYKTSFTLPREIVSGIKKGGRLELQLDGVDTFCAIFLNGRKVTSVNDMFIPWRLNIASAVRPGENELLFFFDSATKVTSELQRRYGFSPGPFESRRVYARRAQYFTGWDWGPRLSGVGLWRPVRLAYWETARITDVAVFTRKISPDHTRAELLVALTLESSSKLSGNISCEIALGGQVKTSLEKTLKLKSGTHTIEHTLVLENPELWFPRGFGKQPLYDINAKVFVDNEAIDEMHGRFGIRTVSINQEPDEEGKKFIIEINGIPIFLKGMNWIPADSFPSRLTGEDYTEWIDLVVDANANCLRVWGGGIYEHDAFYDRCDEKGIVVWQDFMFACGAYPEEQWFFELVKKEAETQVKRLRNHPSIILWCGNNENESMFYACAPKEFKTLPGLKIFTDVLPEVCKRLDPTRPYRQSSPFGGEDPNSPVEGDRHNWDVWSGWQRFENYAKDNARFLSEFGFQSLPRNRTLFSFTKERDHHLNSPALRNHQKMDEGNVRLFRYIYEYLPLPRNFDESSYYSQLLQGEALKLGVEHWRSRKFKTAGALIWQLNDCWPAISWALVDYYRRPKAAYYYARRFFAPILAALKFEPTPDCDNTRPDHIRGKIQCVLVNDYASAQEGTIILNVFTLKGEKIYEKTNNCIIPANGILELGTYSLADLWITRPDIEFVTLRFEQAGRVIAENNFLLQPGKYITFPRPDWRHLRIKQVSPAEFEIRLKSDYFVKCLKLYLDQALWNAAAKEIIGDARPPKIPEYKLDDNFFDLLPGLDKCIHCKFEREVSGELFKAALTFQTLNDAGHKRNP